MATEKNIKINIEKLTRIKSLAAEMRMLNRREITPLLVTGEAEAAKETELTASQKSDIYNQYKVLRDELAGLTADLLNS